MTAPQQIASAVMPVVEGWLRDCPGQPLVLTSHGESVEATIGHRNRDAITLADAARLIGVSVATFRRRSFFGLRRSRGSNKFSRLAVERLREQQRLSGS